MKVVVIAMVLVFLAIAFIDFCCVAVSSIRSREEERNDFES